jgi:SAM-dependent methyltransferase
MKPAAACFACGASGAEAFFEAASVPTHCNRLLATREDALAAPVAGIRLALCPSCGLVFNQDFEAERMRYASGYENSLHFSDTFNAYARDLAARLVDAYGLRGKHVLEVGCGRGDFLRLVCELGPSRGTGFDPSAEAVEVELGGGGHLCISSEDHDACWPAEAVDLVICRHVLEHLDRPVELLDSIRRRGAAAVFFEVPNVLHTLREGGIWDILYEHCSYFAPLSLAALFERAGLAPQRIEEVYGGQFLTLEACADSTSIAIDSERAPVELRALTRSFADLYRAELDQWKQSFEANRRSGRSLAVWGAGTKGVTFLNTFPEHADLVSCVVDRNPRKRGCFIPVSAHPIVAPDDLRSEPPDVVVVMNPLYVREVTEELARMGVASEIWSV